MAEHGGEAPGGLMLRFTEPAVPDMVCLEQLTSAVYLDKQEDVDLYARVMNRLGAKALTPPQTRNVLMRIRDQA